MSRTRRWFMWLGPLVAVVLFGAAVATGFVWPQTEASIGVAIAAALIMLVYSVGVAAMAESRSSRTLWMLLMAPGLAFRMVGTGAVGPALALRAQGSPVEVRVVDVRTESKPRHDYTAYSTTYRFERLDGGADPGPIVFNGRGGYDLRKGDRTRLLVDESGKLPPQLAEKVEPEDHLGMIGLGAVLWLVAYAVGTGTWRWRAQRYARARGF